MRSNEEKRWFKTILSIIREHRACALASVNVEHLLSCWQIGGVLSAKIKQDGWGCATIDRLVDFIHANAPGEKGYGRSNLYSMVGVYEAFSSEDFAALVSKYGRLIVQPSAGQPLPHVLTMTTFSNLVEIVNRTRTAQTHNRGNCINEQKTGICGIARRESSCGTTFHRSRDRPYRTQGASAGRRAPNPQMQLHTYVLHALRD